MASSRLETSLVKALLGPTAAAVGEEGKRYGELEEESEREVQW